MTSEPLSVPRTALNGAHANSAAAGAAAAAAPLHPLLRIQALVTRMRAAFPECGLSLSLLAEWAHDLRGWLGRQSAEVAAIDDELEREFPLFVELFANDPPKKRARALAILREIQARTHQRSTDLAQ